MGSATLGTAVSLGKGIVNVKLAKKKILSESSTEAEMVGRSDSFSLVIGAATSS